MPYVATSLSLILLGIRLKEVFLSKRFAHIVQRRNCARFVDLKRVNFISAETHLCRLPKVKEVLKIMLLLVASVLFIKASPLVSIKLMTTKKNLLNFQFGESGIYKLFFIELISRSLGAHRDKH